MKTFITFSFLFICISLSAQVTTSNSLVGMWQIISTKYGRSPTKPKTLFLKNFDEDGTVKTFALEGNGLIITALGTYNMLTDTTFEQTITRSINTGQSGETRIIKYRLRDPNFLYQKFSFGDVDGEELLMKVDFPLKKVKAAFLR